MWARIAGPGEITPLVKNYMREMGMNPLTYYNLNTTHKIDLIDGAKKWDEQVKNSKKNIPLAVQEYMKYITSMEDEDYYKLSEADKKSLLDEATKWDENKRMGANSRKQGDSSYFADAATWFKQRIPLFSEYNNATWREELGTYTIEDFVRYLTHIKMSYNNFKAMKKKSTIISNAKKWIDNNPASNYLNDFLYNTMEVEAMPETHYTTRSRSGHTPPPKPLHTQVAAAGGRKRRTRKRTQKRSRRNRRATARFFVRGK